MSLPPKKTAGSAVESTNLVLPHHTNAHGNIFGGTVMAWIDATAACVAYRHCRTHTVTASMDKLDFYHPIRLGDIVILKALVNFTSRHSLEVGVKVFSENPLSGEMRHTASAYLTFVAIDDAGKPIPVPPLQPEGEEEKRRFAEGQLRREKSLATRRPPSKT